MRKLIMAVPVVLLMLIPGVASAGGGGGDISACPGFAAGTRVSMLDSCFNGIAHFAPAGTNLTIANDGEFPHTFTAVEGSFDSGMVNPGDSVDLVVEQPGIYEVFCSLHGTADGQGMAGVLVIGEPTPESVAASPIDPAEIGRVVAEGNLVLADAIDRQTFAIGNLSAAQASLRSSVEGLATNAEPIPVANQPTSDGSSDFVVVALIAGLGAGLALSLFGIQRASRKDSQSFATN